MRAWKRKQTHAVTRRHFARVQPVGKRAAGRSAGFTLIEVMTTVVILTLGLLTIMGVFLGAAKANRYAQKIDIASHLAEQTMERFQDVGYGLIQPFSEQYGDIADYPDHRRQVIVTEANSLKDVRVLVFFDNDQHHAEFRTLFTNL